MKYKRKEVIGDCTLYLADCRDVVRCIDVETIVSDPPYGMSFKSNHRKVSHKEIANDKDVGLLQYACDIKFKYSSYIFCRWDNIYDCPKPKSLVTWVKNNHSMGDLNHEHGRMTEVALFYQGSEHSFPNGRPNDVVNSVRTGNNFHPTEKPVDLMRKVIRWTAGVVTDPFMGSGTTGVACVNEGRSFIGIELDEDYFEIACKRIREAYDQPDIFVNTPQQAATQEALTL